MASPRLSRSEEYRLPIKALWEGRHASRIGALVALLALGTGVVFATGGTTYAYPYIMLFPVLLSASWYGVPGGILAASAASIAMAFMPLDTRQGIAQQPENYLLRGAFYLILGGISGWLFHSRRRAFDSHHQVARTDQGSGLANQAALGEDLHERLSTSKPTTTIGVIEVRITDLSDVIEALGLEAADEIVTAMGQRLDAAIDRGSQIYRISPDELALFVINTTPTDIDSICRKLLEVGEESINIHQVPVRVQLTMGSTLARDRKAAEVLLREARLALLTSLRLNRRHTRFDPALFHRSLESLKLIAQVRESLTAREFELHYQPKISLKDGSISGCEGLIRWRGDNGRLIPPGKFMPKVESTSLIGPVTYFVIQSAETFSRDSECGEVISINLSVHNLYDEKVYDLLLEFIATTRVDPGQLEVEITESAFIDDLDTARTAIQRLRDLGISVSIDDFGTGFSSFEYLQHLPISGLKIDRAFVANLETSEKARKLMASMIDIGHALDLVVTAEGVETAQQECILRRLGCDQAQGFYYSPALPGEEFREWCRQWTQRSDGIH